MLKFLFGGKKTTPEVVIESDRARFARLVNELNDLIDGLADKPRVTIDPATGHVLPETPEQFTDEALALPAPEVIIEEPVPAEDDAGSAADEKTPAEQAPDEQSKEEAAPAKAS